MDRRLKIYVQCLHWLYILGVINTTVEFFAFPLSLAVFCFNFSFKPLSLPPPSLISHLPLFLSLSLSCSLSLSSFSLPLFLCLFSLSLELETEIVCPCLLGMADGLNGLCRGMAGHTQRERERWRPMQVMHACGQFLMVNRKIPHDHLEPPLQV